METPKDNSTYSPDQILRALLLVLGVVVFREGYLNDTWSGAVVLGASLLFLSSWRFQPVSNK